jgi:hypothetical protein
MVSADLLKLRDSCRNIASLIISAALNSIRAQHGVHSEKMPFRSGRWCGLSNGRLARHRSDLRKLEVKSTPIMIMFGLLSPEPVGWIQHHPTILERGSRHCHGIHCAQTPGQGEQTAQTCAMAWFQQLWRGSTSLPDSLLHKLIATAIAIPKAQSVAVRSTLEIEQVRFTTLGKCVVGKRHQFGLLILP